MNKMREYERGREDGLDLARRIVKHYSSDGLLIIMKPTILAHHGELKTEHIYKISMKRPIFWVLKDDF